MDKNGGTVSGEGGAKADIQYTAYVCAGHSFRKKLSPKRAVNKRKAK